MDHHRGHTVTGQPATGAAHAARTPIPVARVMGLLAATLAMVAGVGIGAAACLSSLAPSTSTPTSARSITVTTPVPSDPRAGR